MDADLRLSLFTWGDFDIGAGDLDLVDNVVYQAVKYLHRFNWLNGGLGPPYEGLDKDNQENPKKWMVKMGLKYQVAGPTC